MKQYTLLYYAPFPTFRLTNKLYFIRKCCPNVTLRSHQEKHVLFETMVLTRMYEKFKETIQKLYVLMKFVISKTLSGVVSSLINMKFPYRVCVVVQMNCFHAELDQ